MTKSEERSRMSPYPILAFHAVRLGDLVSSLVVASILSFFVYHLRQDEFKIPWTFLFLFVASLLSLVALSLTFAFHLCHSLSPLVSLAANIVVAILWIVGLFLLGWNMMGTLPHKCNSANWGSETGIMVCHAYKTAFAFTLLAVVFLVAMIGLDIRARWQQKSQVKYDHMRDSSYDLKANDRPFSTTVLGRHHEQAVQPWQAGENDPTTYHSRGLSRSGDTSGNFAYSAPAEQTQYDGGSYQTSERR